MYQSWWKTKWKEIQIWSKIIRLPRNVQPTFLSPPSWPRPPQIGHDLALKDQKNLQIIKIIEKIVVSRICQFCYSINFKKNLFPLLWNLSFKCQSDSNFYNWTLNVKDKNLVDTYRHSPGDDSPEPLNPPGQHPPQKTNAVGLLLFQGMAMSTGWPGCWRRSPQWWAVGRP